MGMQGRNQSIDPTLTRRDSGTDEKAPLVECDCARLYGFVREHTKDCPAYVRPASRVRNFTASPQRTACRCGGTLIIGWYKTPRRLEGIRKGKAMYSPVRHIPLCRSCVTRIVEESLK